ncbi:IS3 family transposase [Alicyclobacillus acidoterrestris]|uniref:IS3 family transposase n=1 Tax=Alicyclobacillus acidoterrestris (strain ATCC 49025 / DSM 3922 / CIP 106132 / NCIMB 13137 / GD3B) TaxID=1356854 RepID=A0A9E6ZLZ8_ALIAG|nr:IS3 family transposase [Alicyclobacillus acidoterrestris]UNO49436.1 IS3 family transposase [Alicyclobacillus acidoterrestris]
MGVSRSTYYFQETHEPKPRVYRGGRPIPGYSLARDGRKVSDEQIKEWLMEEVEADGFGYGYVKLMVQLRRHHGVIINKKKVYRLCKELGILKPQRPLHRHYPRKLARNRDITAPNQLWEVDLKYGYIHGEDKFFFILSYIDVFDREIVGYYIGLRCEAKDAVMTLKSALWKRKLLTGGQAMPVIRSDNGPQFISNVFEEACEELKIEHERIPPKTPNMNAHIESFHRLLEDDRLSSCELETYAEAYETVDKYMRWYNNERIHSSVHYLSPAEFHREHVKNGLMTTKPIRV